MNEQELNISEEAQQEVAGGNPVLVVAGAVAGVTAFVSSGAYQDAVDFTSGLFEGFANATN